MRKLATIRIIESTEPIKGKDRVEMAHVDGWTCMVSKADNFKSGDLCIFCEPDSVFPPIDKWDFLKKYNYRIKTQKFKDSDGNPIYSQGLVLPINTLQDFNNLKIGDDVTSKLGITQYEVTMDKEPAIPSKSKWPKWLMKFGWFRNLVLPKHVSGAFPSFVSKTDEERIQNCAQLLQLDTEWIATEKVDGQSGTFAMVRHKKFFRDKFEFIVCSRNFRKPHDDGSSYWRVAKRYDLEKVLKEFLKNHDDLSWVVIQGECIAPNVQKNKYHVKTPDMYVFNLIDSKHGRLSTAVAKDELEPYGLKMVPIIGIIPPLKNMTVQQVLEMANGKSQLYDTLREGIVFRSLDGKISFKAVSPEFLIKHGE